MPQVQRRIGKLRLKKIASSTCLTNTVVGSGRFFALPGGSADSLRSTHIRGGQAQNDGCVLQTSMEDEARKQKNFPSHKDREGKCGPREIELCRWLPLNSVSIYIESQIGWQRTATGGIER